MRNVAALGRPIGRTRINKVRVIPKGGLAPQNAPHPVWGQLRHAFPSRKLSREVNLWRIRNFPNIWRGLWRILLALAFGVSHRYGALYLQRVNRITGKTELFGLASLRVVTTAGVNFLVDALQGSVEPEILRYHGFGTGSNAEDVGNTALHTELTTQYASDNTRPTGTLTEGASANIFRTVATFAPDSGGTIAVTEHGIFSQAATGGGTLLDKSLFSAVNVVAGTDSIVSTYDLTLPAGS